MPDRQVLSLKTSISIKGISAVEIMIGHLGIVTEFWFLYPNRKAGILFVGIFFMLSGYGLMYNFMKKDDYMKHFLVKRLSSIFIPAYIVYLLYGVVGCMITGTPKLGDIIKYIFLAQFFQKINWYVFEIIFFYLLFWFFYKFCSIRTANILLFVSVVLLIGFCFYKQVSNPWYGSSLCFPLGIAYAQREREWNKFFTENYCSKNVLFICICGVCIISFFVLGNNSFIGNPIARNLAAISFCLWVLSILQKVRLEHRLFQWLGRISYEIYLLHLFWIYVIGIYIVEPWEYMAIVIVITLVSAALLHVLVMSAYSLRKIL